MSDDANMNIALAVDCLEAMEERAFSELLSDLRSEPILVERLRNQLEMSEMVSRVLTPARKHFEEGVLARIAGLQASGRSANRGNPSRRPPRQGGRPRAKTHFLAAILCASALVMIFLVAAPWNARPQPMGILASASNASVRHDDGRVESGHAGMPLRRGDEITTTDDLRSGIKVDRSDGTHLAGGGGLQFSCPDEVRVRLDAGALHVDVPHSDRASGDRLIIVTQSGDVHVTGTRFIVTANAARTEIMMEIGSVRLTNKQGEILVSAGERAQMSVDLVPAKLPVTEAPITVIGEPGSPSLSVSATNAQPLQEVSVTLANGPANTQDWIGLYRVGAPDLDKIDWQYLSHNNQPPLIGLSSATLTFRMPAEAGTYEFRLYPNNEWTPILARSPAISVGLPP